MEEEKLNRKGFLRVCAVAAAGSAVVACQGVLPVEGPPTPPAPTAPSPPTPTSPAPTPSPQAAPALTLPGDQADAWSWVKQVEGKITGPAGCEEILVNVNGLDYPAGQEDGAFSASVPLAEGENRIVAICRTPGSEDGVHSEVRSNMIHFHERLRKVPTARISISVERERVLLHGADSTPAEESGPAIIERLWTAHPGNPAPLQLEVVSGLEGQPFSGEVSSETIAVVPPAVDGEYYLQLRVKDQAGREDASAIYFVVVDGRPRIPDYDKENPAWVESAIVYGVIPRLFGSPAFHGITRRLDDLAELGINALWLAPVNVSPPDDYGYAVVDYFELNPSYGTKEDFHRLVQAAHARGIRVLMDFVPNHSSREHPYFQDTLEHGPDSHYWDFYARDEQGEYTFYFDWPHLPNLNYDNPEVRRWMIEAFSYWVREFDVDGFRVDVAWGIRERRPDFWPEWRRELKRIKPDLLLLAEASARDPYYFDNGFDAAYDWTDQLGKWAWGLFWGEDASGVHQGLVADLLRTALTNPPSGYHPDALVFRFLNNNDTGTRFIFTHGPELTRVATALLLTLPGIPCIYTGDEVGEWFRPYFDPAPLAFKERYPGLRDYHRQLVALRKEIPSLHSRLWQLVEVEPDRLVLGYLRYLQGNQEPVLVLLNFSEQEAQVQARLPEEFQGLAQNNSLPDLLSGQQVAFQGADPLRLQLPAFQALILKLSSSES